MLDKFGGKLISPVMLFRLQVPASQESEIVVQGASRNITQQTAEQIRSLVDEHLATSLQKVLPSILKEALASSKEAPQPDNRDDERQEGPKKSLASPLDRFYTTTKECILSDQIVEVIKTAFSKQLSKDIWSDLMEKYPQIKGTENILVAPTMETGTKDYMRQKFGHPKMKEILAFDEGLAERQAPFLTVARPIATALAKLDANDVLDEEGNEIKSLLEDALVLLGNANVRLNQWRQKRFAEYLTDVGKRTLKAGIPTDKHLFPDQFHKMVQSEHDHSGTNSKLIATPPKPSMTTNHKKPFQLGVDKTRNRTRTGGLGLADADWRTRTGGRGLANIKTTPLCVCRKNRKNHLQKLSRLGFSKFM